MWYQLLKVANKYTINRSRNLIHIGNKYAFFANNNFRLYCDQKKTLHPSDTEKKVKELQKQVCISSRKPPLHTCKPDVKPCLPSSPNCQKTGPLDCPWVEKDESKLYKRLTTAGLLLAAAALAYLIYLMNKKEPIIKKPKKVVVLERPVCKEPDSPKLFPKHVPYLLIGGGTASFAAFRAIKSADPKAKVLVISNECYYPYMRPPLSKELWFTDNESKIKTLSFKQWNGSERSLFYEPDDFYTPVHELDKKENGGVSVAMGWNAKKIDVVNRTVYLDDNTTIEYDKCLIATGSKPKNLCVFSQAKKAIQDKVTVYRDIFDFQVINQATKEGEAVAVIGGGFLGSELACALGKKGRQHQMDVYQIFRENGCMGKILPEYLSKWTTTKVQTEGVITVPKEQVEDVSLKKDKYGKYKILLHLSSGKKLFVDHVVVAIGAEPNMELAATSDLEVDPNLGGFLVNTEMEARSHLYIAGDCSCFYDTKLGRRRVEHHDHAVVSGRLAGENMTGASKPYLHQSMFWSDLGPDVGYEAIGIVDASLPTVAVFAKSGTKDKTITKDNRDETNKDKESCSTIGTDVNEENPIDNEDFDKGVIFYLKDNMVVGIVLWNLFNRMSIARQVIKDEKKYDDLNEVAKLFNIHSESTSEPEAATAS